MNNHTTLLSFQQVSGVNRLDELDASLGLTQADLDWLRHVSLPSHALRSAQSPAMFADTILLSADGKPTIPLAGCFTLRASSVNETSGSAYLYTPQGGFKKYDNLQSLGVAIDKDLRDPSAKSDLFRFLSIAQRRELNEATSLTRSSATIDGEVLGTLVGSIEHAQSLNARAMVEELIKMPSLASMLDQLLNEVTVNIDHRNVRVTLAPSTQLASTQQNQPTGSISLSNAILLYFRNQGWPFRHQVAFSHPDITVSAENARQWEAAVKVVAKSLIPNLAKCIEAYWNALSPLHLRRKAFLSQVISDALQATILVEREKNVLSDAQSQELLRLFRTSRSDETLLFIETVRIWEYEPLFVELAGSLMISGNHHFLYTPADGIRVVDSFQAFKGAALGTPMTAARSDTLYSLMSLEERSRFLRFDAPNVSSKPLNPPLADSLADAIIAKQLDNLRYALDMARQDELDMHALVDKALDIRAYINKKLLEHDTRGHWGTRPGFYGDGRPSNYRTDQLQRRINTYTTVACALDSEFERVPLTNELFLQTKLVDLLPELTNVFSVGIRAEAELNELYGTLPSAVHDLIRSVFAYEADYPNRAQRLSVRGFRPDVYSLGLAYSAKGESAFPTLANCFLLTERGGLDTPHSGLAIVWTPVDGLQVFGSVGLARQQLNRQLLDSVRRFGLLENLPPDQRKPHGRYQLKAFELIENNVLLNRMSSFNALFEAEYDYLLALKIGEWRLTGSALAQSVVALRKKGAPTNLARAKQIAQAVRNQQKLAAWLGTASLEDQRLHVELVDQYKNSVDDGKDYLDGIEPLRTYVEKKLTALLKARFPGKDLDPADIQITPNLILAGPAGTLTDFALNHSALRRFKFKVSSSSTGQLPDALNEAAIQQLLLSLDVAKEYQSAVLSELSGDSDNAQLRRSRFRRQVPWQLLQLAHARYLQQHLSASAFELIRQVLDMPDALARYAVDGASAIIRPLELIKTEGSTAVKALGMYLIQPSKDATAPQVLLAPYHQGQLFTEFKDEKSLIAGITLPGRLRDLLIRRLPEGQQATFRNLLASTLGQVSEITLASNPIETNLFDTLYDDNKALLSGLLTTQSDKTRQFDWETALHLFSTGVKFTGRELAGKITLIETLWESYQDFKFSSEAFQEGDWKTGLHNFIAGAAEMVSLGMVNRDDSFGLLDPVDPLRQSAPVNTSPHWRDIASTAPARTELQAFEATGVSLRNLEHNAVDGVYRAAANGKQYAAVAGKVFQVAKAAQTWRVVHENGQGPVLKKVSDRAWMIEPGHQTIRYGKVMSRLAVATENREARRSLNIDARGMADIRRKYPHRAQMIIQAVETARYYTTNVLHNLELVKQGVKSGTRLDTYLKAFFDVDTVDSTLIKKIHTALSPMCQSLADPAWELLNGERIVVGSLRKAADTATAFVLDIHPTGSIYLTQFFFEIDLDWFQGAVPDEFNVYAHFRAATLIHETSHLFMNTLDINYLDASFPFVDIISTVTHKGRQMHDYLEYLQRNGLSGGTPKANLFKELDVESDTLKSLEQLPKNKDLVKEILKTTGCKTMDEARTAFLDPVSPDKRIDLILRNADSITLLVCELGRQRDPTPSTSDPSA